ncbi:DDE family transposase, partial [Melghirimyces profundicolus]
EESIARKHDSPWAEKILPSKGITVYDRGYLDLGRLDGWEDQGHLFVVRLRDNTVVSKQKGLKRLPVEGSNVMGDMSAQLGRVKKTDHRFRVVTFRDGRGKPIRVVTNLWNVPAETIAALYKERWQVELFFRWIKQHLHVKKLFGTSPNAVYNQLYGAFIAYLLLNWLYQQTQPEWRTVKLSFVRFVRKLCWRQLPTEVELSVYELLDRYR